VWGKEVDQKSHKGFTLIELLITVAIVAVLMTVTVVALNPAEYLKKSRDIKRITDLTNLQLALQIVAADKSISMGVCDGTKIYASVPSETPLSNDNLPSGVSWVQVSQANLMKTDGTGWIPIDFNSFASKGIRLPALPIDPKNSVNDYLFYTYTCNSNRQFVLTAWFESQYFGPKGQDPKSKSDGGPDPYLYEVGSNLFISPLKPVASWSFDEGSGTTAYDSSGNGNNGTLVNGPTWTTGKVGGALNFDGVDDYVDLVTGPILGTSNFTFMAWARYQNVNGGGGNPQSVIANATYSCWGPSITEDWGSLKFYLAITSSFSPVSISSILNQFKYLVYVNTGSSVKGYIDGTLTGSSTHSGMNLTSGIWRIGYHGACTGTVTPFNGIIDEVRIYNRALSDAEIKRQYELTK